MSQWDQSHRVFLAEPWQEFWVEVYEDPPLGDWLDARERISEADQRDFGTLDRALEAVRRLVKDHNLVDRAGQRLDLTLRTMSTTLVLTYLTAMTEALSGVGAATAPFPTRTNSPARSSRARRRRPASGTGS